MKKNEFPLLKIQNQNLTKMACEISKMLKHKISHKERIEQSILRRNLLGENLDQVGIVRKES